jgi:hypothetical protein
MSKQTAIEMYSHLYGKEVTMDDRFETKVIWSEELAIKNNGKWIPKEVTMSKQTALQWLLEQWLILESQIPPVIINKALQMERWQIIDAYYYDPNCDEIKDDGEQYYNETYGGQDE